MKTRSVKSSQVPGLSLRVAGSEGLSPSLPTSEMLRADGSEVKEDRRCAGASVDGEGYRAVCSVDGVGGVNDLPSLLAFAVADGQRADGDGVMQRLAVQLNALLHVRVGRQRRQLHLVCCFFCRLGGVGLVVCLGMGGKRWSDKKQGAEQKGAASAGIHGLHKTHENTIHRA